MQDNPPDERDHLDMRLRLALAPVVAGALAIAFATSAPASTPRWAPAATASVHPGVQTFTDGAQCTANFDYTDGTTTYLGQAAHCSGTGTATDTNGCTSQSLPLGTPVTFAGFTGTMVYNSWIAMQRAHETDADTCAYNDLALIALPAAAAAATNPSVPTFGGPTGLAGPPPAGDQVYSYGNSELRLGASPLSPKYGLPLGASSGNWTSDVYTVTPGIPGDSGSGFLDSNGRAWGVLSTVAIAPLPASNGVGSLAKEIAYAQAHGVPGLALVPGTEPFSTGLL
jgi:hypothetical protein